MDNPIAKYQDQFPPDVGPNSLRLHYGTYLSKRSKKTIQEKAMSFQTAGSVEHHSCTAPLPARAHITQCPREKALVMKRKNASINLPPNSPLIVSSTPLQSEESEQQQHRQRTQYLHIPPLVSGDPTPALTKQKKL